MTPQVPGASSQLRANSVRPYPVCLCPQMLIQNACSYILGPDPFNAQDLKQRSTCSPLLSYEPN